METIEHQEWRSRQHVDIGAIFKTTLACGILFFVMSGGSPWSTSGTMNMIMGREVQTSLGNLLIGHFVVSFVYTAIIAMSIYRFKTIGAVALGVVVGIVLYVLNLFVFESLALPMPNKEFVTFFVHVVFSLFAALLYKAFALPKIEDADYHG